nr:MAG TPA: hypothetical protein [Bacteriophage sp.]
MLRKSAVIAHGMIVILVYVAMEIATKELISQMKIIAVDITRKGKTMIDELMEKLLEEPVVNNDEIVFTSRAVELIHEISEKCKGIQIVEQTREQAEEYAKDLSAEQVYVDMLCKIVDAPTTLHMKCSVRMLIPIIDRKLRERGL